jgi:hypothetical protein
MEAPDRLFFVEAPQKERVGPALPQLARDGYAWLERKQITSRLVLKLRKATLKACRALLAGKG